MAGPLRIAVVGGNGFLGSAVCRAALAKNLQVVSISSSGNPYRTPKGHKPAWTDKVTWHKYDVLNPTSEKESARLFDGTFAVVHTLGILLESEEGSSGRTYKTALKENDLLGLVKSLPMLRSTTQNPLRRQGGAGHNSYEMVNRDSAIRVYDAFTSSSYAYPLDEKQQKRVFVYISAEDVFRPFIPTRYISTKRQAEAALTEHHQNHQDHFRNIYVRPGLMYHAHQRPLTTLPAALLDLSATLHEHASTSPFSALLPTPAGSLRTIARSISPGATSNSGMARTSSTRTLNLSLTSSPLDAIANALTIRPMHVDQVARAIVKAILDGNYHSYRQQRQEQPQQRQQQQPEGEGEGGDGHAVMGVSDMLEYISRKDPNLEAGHSND